MQGRGEMGDGRFTSCCQCHPGFDIKGLWHVLYTPNLNDTRAEMWPLHSVRGSRSLRLHCAELNSCSLFFLWNWQHTSLLMIKYCSHKVAIGWIVHTELSLCWTSNWQQWKMCLSVNKCVTLIGRLLWIAHDMLELANAQAQIQKKVQVWVLLIWTWLAIGYCHGQPSGHPHCFPRWSCDHRGQSFRVYLRLKHSICI